MNLGQQPPIKSLIVRLNKGSLILPVNLMAELVTGGELLPSEHPGVEGWLHWRNRQNPVVSLESLCMEEDAALHCPAGTGWLEYAGNFAGYLAG